MILIFFNGGQNKGKKRLNLLILLLIAAGFALPGIIFAKTGQGAVVKLNEIVVAATKTGKMLEDAPISISVISKKEIRQLNIRTMGGVINIITKISEKFNANATAGYGTHGARRYRLSICNRFANKFSLRIGDERESTDGYKITPVQKTIKSGTGILFGLCFSVDKILDKK